MPRVPPRARGMAYPYGQSRRCDRSAQTEMHGDFLRQTLEENDVDCSGLVSDPDHFTTLAFVALDPTGERTFSFARKPGADTKLRADEPNRDVL